MHKKLGLIVSLALAAGACSGIQNTMGRLGVKDYTSSSGQRVMAGQAEPRSEYNCQKMAQDSQDWGLKGNIDKGAATERVTAVAVDAAPGKGANYAFVMIPSETSVMGFNVNACKGAPVAYYR